MLALWIQHQRSRTHLLPQLQKGLELARFLQRLRSFHGRKFSSGKHAAKQPNDHFPDSDDDTGAVKPSGIAANVPCKFATAIDAAPLKILVAHHFLGLGWDGSYGLLGSASRGADAVVHSFPEPRLILRGDSGCHSFHGVATHLRNEGVEMTKSKAKTGKKSLDSRHLPSADVVKRTKLDDLTPRQLQLFLAFQVGIEEARGQAQPEGCWVLSWHIANGREQIRIDEVGPTYEPGPRDLAVSETRIGILTITAHAVSRFVNDLVDNQHLAVENLAPPPIFINGEPIGPFEISAELYPDNLREMVAGWEAEGKHAIAEAGREALAMANATCEAQARTVTNNLVGKQIPFEEAPVVALRASKRKTFGSSKPRLH